MKKIENLKNLLKESISVSENEKNEIIIFSEKNPEKIEQIIKIFEDEKNKNLENIINYLKK